MAAWCIVAVAAMAQASSGDLEQCVDLLDRLEATAITVEYEDEPLQQVLDDLKERLPVPLRADWDALLRVGVHAHDAVSLRVPPSSAATALASLALTLGDEFERPTFEVHAGQVILTTVEATTAMRVTGVYDVRDLLTNARLVQRLRDESPLNSGGASDAEAKTVGGERNAAPDERPADPSPDADSSSSPRPLTPGEELLLLITDHIDPEAWMNFGGDRARISEINSGVLMVTAPPTTHRRFRNALQRLRQANPTSVAIDAAIIDVPRAVLERASRQHGSTSLVVAAAVRSDPAAALIWQTAQTVALDAKLETQSSSGTIQITVALSPHLDRESGLLRIEAHARTVAEAGEQSVQTTVALSTEQSMAIIELPDLTHSGNVRILLLTVQRK